MTTAATYTRPVEWRTPLWNAICVVASIVSIIWGFVALIQFQTTASQEGNPVTWENTLFYGGVALGILYVAVGVAGGIVAGFEDYCGAFWRKLARRFGLNEFVMWLTGLGSIPVVVLICMSLIPHQLITTPGMVRVMDDGRVLSAGQTIISDRYHAHSVLVPLTEMVVASYDLYAVPGTRDAVTVTIQAEYHLRDNRELRAVLSAHKDQLGIGEYDSQVHSDRYPTLLTQLSDSYVRPTLYEVEQAIRSGMVSGSHNATLIHMEHLSERTVLPPWIESIQVKDIFVSGITIAD